MEIVIYFPYYHALIRHKRAVAAAIAAGGTVIAILIIVLWLLAKTAFIGYIWTSGRPLWLKIGIIAGGFACNILTVVAPLALTKFIRWLCRLARISFRFEDGPWSVKAMTMKP